MRELYISIDQRVFINILTFSYPIF